MDRQRLAVERGEGGAQPRRAAPDFRDAARGFRMLSQQGGDLRAAARIETLIGVKLQLGLAQGQAAGGRGAQMRARQAEGLSGEQRPRPKKSRLRLGRVEIENLGDLLAIHPFQHGQRQHGARVEGQGAHRPRLGRPGTVCRSPLATRGRNLLTTRAGFFGAGRSRRSLQLGARQNGEAAIERQPQGLRRRQSGVGKKAEQGAMNKVVGVEIGAKAPPRA